ncbi:uncharacterized protein BJ212DRAFT_1350031 [Suillus subaureus]|uniref:Uncharacterized protein n=1 Tax=Suillus subaureus TaxID=48587 RepID=A0A9P7ECS3_9AGAM|nr:uncharacterized protein BJ212DRAFT_1350031 [Suillus subaureus]KAG1817664.1 hypothetical protein BJ212DRAFT_1350031 [Suillus subaureus]
MIHESKSSFNSGCALDIQIASRAGQTDLFSCSISPVPSSTASAFPLASLTGLKTSASGAWLVVFASPIRREKR